MRIPRRVIWALFFVGQVSGILGAYELIYQGWQLGGAHPIWSGTLGAPIPHHYIDGFILAGAAVFWLLWTEKEAKHEETRI